MKENKAFLHEAWSEMSTAQLDEALQQELQKENPEAEVVLGIMRVIQDREADYPVEFTEEVSAAWEEYKEKTVPPKKHNRMRTWLVSVAAAAAVICVVVMALPQTVEAESIFDVFFRWTESVFEFFTPGQDNPKPSTEYVFQTDHPGLQQVYDKVTELGVTEPIVPMWVPEGYVLTELKSTQVLNVSKVYATLQRNDNTIILAYRITEDVIASKHEKEDTSVEAYEYMDVHHFIMDNDRNILVTWVADGAECSISTDLGKKEVYKIVKSIYIGDYHEK